MNKKIIVAALLGFFSLNSFAGEGDLLIQPKKGFSKANLHALIQQEKGTIKEEIRGIDVQVVSFPDEDTKGKAKTKLKMHKGIKFIEEDKKVPHSFISNDPTTAWQNTKIGAPAAWDISQGNGQIIAILDSGILATHPDLSASIVPGYNVYDNNYDLTDVIGHGTAVAGVAAAILNNATGSAGVAGQAQIMPIRISDTTGYAYFSAMAKGLTWAADNGADIANISYQNAAGSSTVWAAADYLRSKGGLVVIAAGNTGIQESFAQSNSVISVSATDSNDNKASWSSYGSYVDLSAPGVSVYTTNSSGGYSNASGTSFSAPITAGGVALVKSLIPQASPTEVEQILTSTAKDLGTAGYDIFFGNGRLDVAAAMNAAQNYQFIDRTAPTVSITSPVNNFTTEQPFSVDINAVDNVRVENVELLVNGVSYGTDTTAPYSYYVDTTTYTDGTLRLVAKAYDATGNVGSSTAINVVLSRVVATPDTTAPTITSFRTSTSRTSVKVTATATDNKAVTQMTLAINGKVVATSSSGSLSYTWNTRKVASGTYQMTVMAKDAAGNTTTQSWNYTK